MKVVLNKDVPKIGQQGSIVTVSDGYARNFLIPRGLASVATKAAHHKLKTQKESIQRKEEKKEAGIKKNQKELANVALCVSKKANKQGHLFAAVTNADIIKELKRKKFISIKDDDIAGTPLKAVGEHTILIAVGGKEIPVSVTVMADE